MSDTDRQVAAEATVAADGGKQPPNHTLPALVFGLTFIW